MVKELFWTIQGEGVNAGRAAMFVRLAGCNLWSGRPEARGNGFGACAEWCDTDFFKGDRLPIVELEKRMADVALIQGVFRGERTLCVITGGEPCLQLSTALVKHLLRQGWEVAVETNGTIANEALELCDHVCVSPKLGTELAVNAAHELKVVLPGASRAHPNGWTDGQLLLLAKDGHWQHKFVQPQDPLLSRAVEDTVLHPIANGTARPHAAKRLIFEQNVQRCTEWVQQHPEWRLSLQTHKFVGVP